MGLLYSANPNQLNGWAILTPLTVFVLVSHILVDKGPLPPQPHAIPTASHNLVFFFSLGRKLQLGPMS